jgi:hypothetical protein
MSKICCDKADLTQSCSIAYKSFASFEIYHQPINYLNQKCCSKQDRGSYSRSQKVLRALLIISREPKAEIQVLDNKLLLSFKAYPWFKTQLREWGNFFLDSDTGTQRYKRKEFLSWESEVLWILNLVNWNGGDHFYKHVCYLLSQGGL